MAVIGLFAAVLPGHAQYSDPSASALSIPQTQLIQPEALNRSLQSASSKVTILQVGSRLMFQQAHIPGSQYAGPGSQAAGLQLLADKVRSLPKSAVIVIYCGCCPWNRCPNMGPAFKQLHELGFTNVKALYIADNFGEDWVKKGYAVEKGD